MSNRTTIADKLKLGSLALMIAAGGLIDGTIAPPQQSPETETATTIDPDANPWLGICLEDETVITVTDPLGFPDMAGVVGCVAVGDIRPVGDAWGTGEGEDVTAANPGDVTPDITDPATAATFADCADNGGYSDLALARCADRFGLACSPRDPYVTPLRANC